MEIAQQIQSTTQNTAPIAPAASRLSSDFDTFLRMLTVQMQNQDPLNPVDSNDFATQLATFSGVEQAVQTNDLLRNLSSQFGVSGLSDMASWIGKEVRIAIPIEFSGAPVTLYPAPLQDAQAGEIVVRDLTGNEVQRFATPVSTAPLEWPVSGQSIPQGTYSVNFVSINNGQSIGETPVAVYTQVTEVRLDAGQAVLGLIGGESVVATDVTALRDRL
jgi:flagellar basal-body rod modification protein FlgD